MDLQEINKLVAGLPDGDKGNVSDGYHTFNELYDHRITNYIALCRTLSRNDYGKVIFEERDVWKSRLHSDGTAWEGWFLLGIFKEHGKQITYHLPISYWDECLFAYELSQAPPFDGHTSKDVLERLKAL